MSGSVFCLTLADNLERGIKMKFYVYQTPDQDKGDPGVHCTFVDEDGRKSSTFFSSPPENISHVDQGYLKDRFTNVQTEQQANFIKERFPYELKKLKGSNAHVKGVGIFVNGMKMADYDIEDYSMAIEALNHAYEETGEPHELRLIR